MYYIGASALLLLLKIYGLIKWSLLVCFVPIIIWIGTMVFMWISTGVLYIVVAVKNHMRIRRYRKEIEKIRGDKED